MTSWWNWHTRNAKDVVFESSSLSEAKNITVHKIAFNDEKCYLKSIYWLLKIWKSNPKSKGVVSKTTSKHLFVVWLQDPPLPNRRSAGIGKRTYLESRWWKRRAGSRPVFSAIIWKVNARGLAARLLSDAITLNKWLGFNYSAFRH